MAGGPVRAAVCGTACRTDPRTSASEAGRAEQPHLVAQRTRTSDQPDYDFAVLMCDQESNSQAGPTPAILGVAFARIALELIADRVLVAADMVLKEGAAIEFEANAVSRASAQGDLPLGSAYSRMLSSLRATTAAQGYRDVCRGFLG